jgi:hypothetical protein
MLFNLYVLNCDLCDLYDFCESHESHESQKSQFKKISYVRWVCPPYLLFNKFKIVEHIENQDLVVEIMQHYDSQYWQSQWTEILKKIYG